MFNREFEVCDFESPIVLNYMHLRKVIVCVSVGSAMEFVKHRMLFIYSIIMHNRKCVLPTASSSPG